MLVALWRLMARMQYARNARVKALTPPLLILMLPLLPFLLHFASFRYYAAAASSFFSRHEDTPLLMALRCRCCCDSAYFRHDDDVAGCWRSPPLMPRHMRCYAAEICCRLLTSSPPDADISFSMASADG